MSRFTTKHNYIKPKDTHSLEFRLCAQYLIKVV